MDHFFAITVEDSFNTPENLQTFAEVLEETAPYLGILRYGAKGEVPVTFDIVSDSNYRCINLGSFGCYDVATNHISVRGELFAVNGVEFAKRVWRHEINHAIDDLKAPDEVVGNERVFHFASDDPNHPIHNLMTRGCTAVTRMLAGSQSLLGESEQDGFCGNAREAIASSNYYLGLGLIEQLISTGGNIDEIVAAVKASQKRSPLLTSFLVYCIVSEDGVIFDLGTLLALFRLTQPNTEEREIVREKILALKAFEQREQSQGAQ